jgi:hypothetical protein
MEHDDMIVTIKVQGVERRYCSWAINSLESDYEVIRYENGEVILVGRYATRHAAWAAAHDNRELVLADPMAMESHAIEYRTRG